MSQQNTSIPPNALVRFIALLDEPADDNENSNSVVMNAAQAASLSKLVADQALATDWEEQQPQPQPTETEGEEKPTANSAAAAAPEIMIPVPIGNTDNLRAIVKYLTSRLASPQREIPAPLVSSIEDAVDDCDKAFLSSLPNLNRDVIPLASIAHYLNIPTLRDLMCAALANQLTMMTVEQMQATLGVTNDFSPGELNVLKKQFGLMEEKHWRSGASGAAESS